MRLIDHLMAAGLKRKAAKDALRTGKVKVNGVPTALAAREVDPTTVVYDPSAPRLTVGRDLAVIHRDADLAVVWKPSGLLSVPAPGRRDPNVLGVVGNLFGRTHAVHRLDEGTSGLMVVAFNEETQARLKDQFAAHTADRHYLALVCPRFPEKPTTLRSNLVRDRGDGKRGSGKGPGKHGITHVALAKHVSKKVSLVSARLETGRTHQVRIHLSEMGHPVLGDKLYGDKRSVAMFPRLALHAETLAFQHPTSKAAMHFTAPLADDLQAVLHQWTHEHLGAKPA